MNPCPQVESVPTSTDIVFILGEAKLGKRRPTKQCPSAGFLELKGVPYPLAVTLTNLAPGTGISETSDPNASYLRVSVSWSVGLTKTEVIGHCLHFFRNFIDSYCLRSD